MGPPRTCGGLENVSSRACKSVKNWLPSSVSRAFCPGRPALEGGAVYKWGYPGSTPAKDYIARAEKPRQAKAISARTAIAISTSVERPKTENRSITTLMVHWIKVWTTRRAT